jgi:hypothetical protein
MSSAPICATCRGGADASRAIDASRAQAGVALFPPAGDGVPDQHVREQDAEGDEARLEEDNQVVAKQVGQQEHPPCH